MPDPAESVRVAKAVAGKISAAKFDQEFELERSYAEWDLDLTKMDALALTDAEKVRVDVVSHTTEQKVELVSRSKVQYTVPIDIAVRRKFGSEKQDADTGRIAVEEIDRLMLLVQQLHLMFLPQNLSDFDFPVWDGENGGTLLLAAPVRDHLRDLRQFTGLIRITFRADVEIGAIS